MSEEINNQLDALNAQIAELKNLSHNQTDLIERQFEKINVLEQGYDVATLNFGGITESFIPPSGGSVGTPEGIDNYLAKMKIENRTLPSGLTSFLSPYDIEAGDILLVTPKDMQTQGKLKYRQTFDTQYKILQDDFGITHNEAVKHAIYTHVAISRRGHQIYESLPGQGIIQSTFWKYMNDDAYEIKVRRLKDYSALDRSQLVFNIAQLFGNEYSPMDLAALKAKANRYSFLATLFEAIGGDDNYICSGLFAAICQKEFIDLKLNQESSKLVTPAHLSFSPAMETIGINRVNMPENHLGGF